MSSLPTFVTLFLVSIYGLSHCDASEAPKVKLALYYESLCPGCQQFITTLLDDALSSDLMAIADLSLVPFGNAQITNDIVECQHGPRECYFNTIEACAINAWPDTATHYKFIECVESELDVGAKGSNFADEKVWKSCCDKLGLSPNPISDCYNGDLGDQLIMKNANNTPDHEFVPWVTVDEVALEDNFVDFVKYVCKAYKGTDLPEACKNQKLSFVSDTAIAGSEIEKTDKMYPNVC